jgi:DNA invertase Pin-like site-specific DNA recombinase
VKNTQRRHWRPVASAKGLRSKEHAIATLLQPLQEAAGRLGRSIVAVYRDEGISGGTGRAKRPGLDARLKGVARRDFDIVAAWSVCRLGRSLPDLISLLGELRSRDIDLYLHQQAPDTSTPSGRMLFGMLSVFSEFERAMISRSGDGWAGSSAVIWQAAGPTEDDAVHGAAHSSGIG